jgi:nicotinamidase-related amidase
MCDGDSTHNHMSRRNLMLGTGVLAATAIVATSASGQTASPSADASGNQLTVNKADTAVVFIDPQNDVLSEKGAKIFEAAKSGGYHVFISPHYFYPTDVNQWKFIDPLESEEVANHSFARKGPLDLAGFKGSGADWLDRFKPYIEDGKTIVVSPHKVWGPQTNDLVLQLRKRGIQKVILGGMLANMCVESHLRELLEQGFQVAVIKDATAGPRHPVWGDGYQAALVNYNFLAHAVWSTSEVVQGMG